MSSLFLGERRAIADSKGPESIRVDVDHKFARTSVLRFQTYVYNADALEPDVWIEARVLHGKDRVLTFQNNRVPNSAAKDQNSLPYWSEISLLDLPPGNYTLQVEATERRNNRTTQQQTNFIIE